MLRRLRSCVAAWSLLWMGLAACGGQGTQGGDSTSTADSQAALRGQSGGSSGSALRDDPEPGLDGAPKDNPNATGGYLTALDFKYSDGTATFGDEADFDCEPRVHVLLRIEPEDSVARFSRSDMKKDHGRFIAKITNVDSRRVNCKIFDLEYGESAYLWVGKNNQDVEIAEVYKAERKKGRWKIRKVAEAASFAENATGDHGGSRACWDPLASGEKACVPRAHTSYEAQHQGKGVPLTNHDDAWISCVGGCCRVGGLFAKPDP